LKSDLLHSPRPRAPGITAPFLVFSGLLLAILIPDVILRAPILPPEMRRDWVVQHQSVQYFSLAEEIIAKRLPSPATRWSAAAMPSEVGRGVWYGQGEVAVGLPSGEEKVIPWKIFFIPGSAQPLYLNLGSRQEGTISTALERAGVQPAKP
jgi:hypothetical protein